MSIFPRLPLPKSILEVLNGFVFAVTLAGAGIVRAISPHWRWYIWAAIITALAYIYATVALSKDTPQSKTLKEGSKRFAKYFSMWYLQEGDLKIYSRNLEWLESDSARPIRDAIRKKGAHAQLYLREINSLTCSSLQSSGCVIHQVSHTTHSQVRLSLNENDGVEKLILRARHPKSGKVHFISSDDQYLIGLAKDLLSNCSMGASVTTPDQ